MRSHNVCTHWMHHVRILRIGPKMVHYKRNRFPTIYQWQYMCCVHHHHHHHISFMELDHLLTRSGLTYPEVSSKVYHDSFCQLGSSISFIHLLVCLTTGPKPLPNRTLHIVRSRASSFKCEYPLLSLRSSSSFLRFLPRLPVTSVPPFIFPSITRCRRQFLRKMWPIQLAFRFIISCRIFLCSLTLNNTSSFLT